MFRLIALVALLCLGNACQPDTVKDQPLSPAEQENYIKRMIRYTARMPDKANLENRLDDQWQAHYDEQAALHRMDRYYRDPRSGKAFFLVSRIAPSLKVKRVAIGIEAGFDRDSLTYYREVFRTWKMEEPELTEKGDFLFDRMVKAQDLSPYYPENSGKEEFIEFPDAHTHFDTLSRSWVSSLGKVMDLLNR